MNIKTGTVEKSSPVYDFIARHIAGKAHMSDHPRLEVTRLKGSHEVYLVTDMKEHQSVILKSYDRPGVHRSRLVRNMDREYDRLKYVNRIGVAGSNYRSVRPLGRSHEMLFFIEEHIRGRPFSDYIKDALVHNEYDRLYDKITLLAGYLSKLHKKTMTGHRANAHTVKKEMERYLYQSNLTGRVDPWKQSCIQHMADRWQSLPLIKDAMSALTHGDATPSNFLFKHDKLYVIDFERSGCRDPVYDLGMVSGELAHFAMAYTSDPYRADPFIGHLYWMYAGNFKDQYGEFLSLTRRNPFYMANCLIRISRNPEHSREYKDRLIYHAMECLKSIER